MDLMHDRRNAGWPMSLWLSVRSSQMISFVCPSSWRRIWFLDVRMLHPGHAIAMVYFWCPERDTGARERHRWLWWRWNTTVVDAVVVWKGGWWFRDGARVVEFMSEWLWDVLTEVEIMRLFSQVVEG